MIEAAVPVLVAAATGLSVLITWIYTPEYQRLIIVLISLN